MAAFRFLKAGLIFAAAALYIREEEDLRWAVGAISIALLHHGLLTLKLRVLGIPRVEVTPGTLGKRTQQCLPERLAEKERDLGKGGKPVTLSDTTPPRNVMLSEGGIHPPNSGGGRGKSVLVLGILKVLDHCFCS